MSLLSEAERSDFQDYIANQLAQVPNFEEDTSEVAEYIALLVNNGRPIEETLEQLNELFGGHDLRAVVANCYKALETYKQQQMSSSQSVPPQSSEQQPPQSSLPPSSAPQSSGQDNDLIGDGDLINRTLPTKPAAYSRNGYGVSKNGRGGHSRNGDSPKGFAFKNQNALAKALNLSHLAGTDTFINAKGQIKKKGRCHKFPHCPLGRECVYAHPSTPCFRFRDGECPNAPGTCNYLHPGEDDALIAELEKVRAEFQEKKKQNQMRFIQNNVGIAMCKFGITCSNQHCPFGHPTPANEDAKVIILEWCPANLNCADPSCTKAHSSLSKIREVKPLKAPNSAPEKSLDPCKFGANCTNRHCKFRHATSHVPCRDGESCTRIDCFFSHPIKEDCRFGENCKNPKCLFKHPNGKAPAAGQIQTKSLTWTKTNERQFAVPDEQVLETAPPQVQEQ
jgi:hypothetical protein